MTGIEPMTYFQIPILFPFGQVRFLNFCSFILLYYPSYHYIIIIFFIWIIKYINIYYYLYLNINIIIIILCFIYINSIFNLIK